MTINRKYLLFEMVAITSLDESCNYNEMSKLTIYKPLSKICKNGKYHGCWAIYEDGTRQLITKKHKCKFPTDDLFWKHAKTLILK